MEGVQGVAVAVIWGVVVEVGWKVAVGVRRVRGVWVVFGGTQVIGV